MLVTIAVTTALAVACVAAGALAGWKAARAYGREEEALRTQQRKQDERIKILETRRVSAARPGTRPGRVSVAEMNTGETHMTSNGPHEV